MKKNAWIGFLMLSFVVVASDKEGIDDSKFLSPSSPSTLRFRKNQLPSPVVKKDEQQEPLSSILPIVYLTSIVGGQANCILLASPKSPPKLKVE